MQPLDDHTRRDRLIMQIRPALMRMAGRYRRKAGLPWQWREDHCHELVFGAMEAYGRHEHLPDDQLRRVMVRAAHCDHLNIMEQNIVRSSLSITNTGYMDVIAERNDTAREIEAIDMSDWLAVHAKRAMLTSREVTVIISKAQGLTNREIAEAIGVSLRTAHYCLAAARRKLATCLARDSPESGYTVSAPQRKAERRNT